MIQLQRVYEKSEPGDGAKREGARRDSGTRAGSRRFLVERLWPRGLRKADLHMDGWEKEAAPSDQLRKWFSHDPEKWREFQRKYVAELKTRPEAWRPILDAARRGTVTLLYSSHDTEHNNAVALKRFLDKKLGASGAVKRRKTRTTSGGS